MPNSLLLIEDEDLLGDELVRHYRKDGWDVTRARNLAEARQCLIQDGLGPLVVISDMSLPDGNALDLLEVVRDRTAGGEWILLTGYGTIPDSVRALRLGAYDFLEKPCSTSRLDMVVASAARSATAQHRLRVQTARNNRRFTPDAFVGCSVAAQHVRTLLTQLSAVPLSAVILGGETGVGKGLAARILHYRGPRAHGPLIEVNCASLPKELLESELFGHEPGAFTGAKGRHRGLIEQAHTGTLFLDEIGDLSLGLQAKLLRAIEDQRFRRVGGEREIDVDVQFFTASNRDLAAAVCNGSFREDLYHRLNVFNLTIPPLRDRTEDLDELTSLFVSEYNAKAGKRVSYISPTIWETLRAYRWPGNVRELRNVIERCVLLAETEDLPERWVQLEPQVTKPSSGLRVDGTMLQLPLDGTMALEDMERHIIRTALEQAQYNVTAAARALGTTRQTLRYRIEKYHLKPEPPSR
jgi:DNA-binding NtrC family response regulator